MSISREVLAKYIKPGCRFIETGTRWGDTCIKAIELGANDASSCEVDQLMATIAQMHCNDVVGDSVDVEHMESIAYLGYTGYEDWQDSKNVVLFLDAHTDTYSPAMKELEVVHSRWKSLPGAILIDDLRCMEGWGVLIDRLQGKLLDMGYRVGYEDGVVPGDIMVGVMP